MVKRRGIHPVSEDWSLLAELTTGAKTLWLVYVRHDPSGWTNIKIAAKAKAGRKANYWLGWNGERFARGRDLEFLMTHRPSLYKDLVEELRFL